MVNISFFDFDGTITQSDTFTPFIYRTVDPKRLKWGKLMLLPYIVGYKLGFISGSVIRSKIFKSGFQGANAALLRKAALEYSQNDLPQVIRPNAMQQIDWHLAQGDKVVVISASIDVYLKPWCKLHGLDLICNEIEENHGVLTGMYKHQDCSGIIKKNRILENYNLSDFEEVYVYGDTIEDREMLSLGTKRFYQWQEVANDFFA
ncbi:HAD-IB family phosphatase [Alkanindiges illinoisensis]|uniref:HAD-IB family hydrolase n=1 Tax=Alkanindiges illinoisensis TaxID=197183 RepID=A0A4Y7X9F7_9GAMM|nr:HAD-IB family phosphatase [Alkanindiges illinoisensis]TEU24163.1 HAD-IB family hydrolase [Alkanindiges illinoisensis]